MGHKFEAGAYMSDYYATHFMDYHQKTVSVEPTFLRPFVNRLEKRASILDVGCGSGRDLRYLRKSGFVVTGFEKSPGLANLARIHSGCAVIQGDFETYPFESVAVDAILLSAALVHVPFPVMAAPLMRILNALNPESPRGGLIYLSLKEGVGTRRDKTGRIFYLWQDSLLRELFDQCGLEILYFDRNISAINTGDIWLGYVLKRLKTEDWRLEAGD